MTKTMTAARRASFVSEITLWTRIYREIKRVDQALRLDEALNQLIGGQHGATQDGTQRDGKAQPASGGALVAAGADRQATGRIGGRA
jgi:hypothetical protein